MAIWADDAAARRWESADMAQWTTRTQANASPEQVLEVLTDPDAIRLWSPIDFEVDVRYDLAPAGGGSEVTATVGLRRGGGITGRLISKATAALLSAGALDGAARSIAHAAERTPALALA